MTELNKHDRRNECEGCTWTFLISVVTFKSYETGKRPFGLVCTIVTNQRENNYEWVSNVIVAHFYKGIKTDDK